MCLDPVHDLAQQRSLAHNRHLEVGGPELHLAACGAHEYIPHRDRGDRTYLFPSVSAAVHFNSCLFPPEDEAESGSMKSDPRHGFPYGTCWLGVGMSDSRWVGSLNMFLSSVTSDGRWREVLKMRVLDMRL